MGKKQQPAAAPAAIDPALAAAQAREEARARTDRISMLQGQLTSDTAGLRQRRNMAVIGQSLLGM